VRSGARAMFHSRPIPEYFLPSLRKGAVLVAGHQSQALKEGNQHDSRHPTKLF
jgi:hypothetical protein